MGDNVIDLNTRDPRPGVLSAGITPADIRVPFAPPSDVLAVVAARLRTALAVLPDTADGIARYLAQRGIRGAQCQSGACPLSVYLTRVCGHAVYVDGHDVTATNTRWCLTQALPAACVGFVAGFDSEEWPSLVIDYAPADSLAALALPADTVAVPPHVWRSLRAILGLTDDDGADDE